MVEGANLLARTNFVFDYYFKRYDGQVRFFKWNYVFWRPELIVRSKTNSISINVYTLFSLVFKILRLQIYWFSLEENCLV